MITDAPYDPNQTAELSAGPIRYSDEGSGPVLVFVHGFGVDGRLWAATAADLTADHRVIVPTWPMGSHTLAMNADAALDPTSMAALISEFLSALDLDDVTIIGNDSGGAVSQILVTEHPERIGRLVLTNCDAFESFPPGRFKLLLGSMKVPGFVHVLGQSMRIPGLAASPLAFGALTKDKIPAAVLKAWTAPLIESREVRRDAKKFATGCDPKLTQAAARKLPGLKIPGLMVWGEDDKFFKIRDAHRLADLIPDARVVAVPNAVTFISLEQPERVASEIRGFATR